MAHFEVPPRFAISSYADGIEGKQATESSSSDRQAPVVLPQGNAILEARDGS